MKNFIKMTISCLILTAVSLPIFSQNNTSDNVKRLKFRTTREIRKTARQYKADGYSVAVGAMSLERQLSDAWIRENEKDSTGFPKYIVASGRSLGETQIAAKIQAVESAKIELAGTIATNISVIIENNIANAQLNSDEALSVTKTVAAAKNIIAQQIGRTITLVELYRKVGKNTEVNIRIAYNSDMANRMAMKAVRQKLEEDTDLLQEKLEKLMKL